MSDTYHPPRSDEAAWAAGIFEGEGSISQSAYRRNTWYLRINMTDEDVVRRFHEVVGCGSVTGPKPNGKRLDGEDKKLVWTWGAGAQGDVTHILSLFLPYMGKRRKLRALEALSFIVPRLHAREAANG